MKPGEVNAITFINRDEVVISGFGIFRSMRDSSFKISYSVNVNGKVECTEQTKSFVVDVASKD